MRFSMHAPVGDITPGQFQNLHAVRSIAAAFEAAGIDAAYVTDHPAPGAKWLHANGHDALDPFSALSFLAAASTRLLLVSFLIVLPYRNPFMTAKSAATLQVLSDGRFIMGAGGGYQKTEFNALGVDFHQRGALFDEALEVIQLAWRGGAVSAQGRSFTATEVEPRPVPTPPPPIWIGGSVDKAVKRAAQWGDGWAPVFAAPTQHPANRATFIQSHDELRDKISMVHELRASLGRTGPFEIAIPAREKPQVGTPGGADHYLEALAGLSEIGVTWAMIDIPHPSLPAFLDNVQWFGEEVVARMKIEGAGAA